MQLDRWAGMQYGAVGAASSAGLRLGRSWWGWGWAGSQPAAGVGSCIRALCEPRGGLREPAQRLLERRLAATRKVAVEQRAQRPFEALHCTGIRGLGVVRGAAADFGGVGGGTGVLADDEVCVATRWRGKREISAARKRG